MAIPIEREQWQSRLGFMLAASGSAVGLGNIWRFPWLTGENGGGTFLFTYLILIFTIGLSVLMAEFALGRASQRDVVGAYETIGSKKWSWVGYVSVLTGLLIMSFYCVVGGWTLSYAFRAGMGQLAGDDAEVLQTIFSTFTASSLEPVFWQLLFIVLTVYVVMRGISSGIERWSRILMPILLVLLVGLAIWVLFLPGAWEGVKYMFLPDFSKFTPSMLVTALSQALFSLSVGMGAMITYGSYLKQQENLPRAALAVTALDTFVALVAGLLILPAVFAFGYSLDGGPGLAFVTLPAIFSGLPGALVLSTAFFLLLAIAALTSAVSILEVAVAWVHSQVSVSRQKSALLVGVIVTIMGVPVSLSFGIWQDVTLVGLNLFELADGLSGKIMLPVGALALAIFVGWIVWPRIRDEVLQGSEGSAATVRVWGFICRYIAPPAIVVILVAGLIS
ncbi:MAG: sodium-dependent transporter [Parvularculales bacterium]